MIPAIDLTAIDLTAIDLAALDPTRSRFSRGGEAMNSLHSKKISHMLVSAQKYQLMMRNTLP
jgi:hypothetical protein